MRLLLLLLTGILARGQDSTQFQHRFTFGSKNGIHPRRVLNTRAAKAALGAGEHPYGLGFPEAVTTDNRGRIWIADSGTSSVHIFDPAGTAYREIRRLGDATLQQPAGIVTDEAGRIYLSDAGTANIYVFEENGEFDRALFRRGEHPLEKPAALALSNDGRTIYVADPPRNVVVALNREGEVDATIHLPEERTEPSAISVANNQLYILGSRQHRIYMMSPSGRALGELHFDGITVPTAFAYDATQRRFLAANPRSTTVQVFDEDARNLGSFGQYGDAVDQMKRVDSLYVDPHGMVYVIDSHNGKILVFSESDRR